MPAKLAWRLAVRLAAAHRGRTPPAPDWDALDAIVTGVTAARRRLARAAAHGLRLARPALAAALAARLDDLARHAERVRAAFELPPEPPGPAELFRELRQLEDEFGGIEARRDECVLRAVTDPVVLGGVRLGPFAIDYHWGTGRSHGAGCFRVAALRPNPAAGSPDVTHPHVRGGEVCAGDAAAPVRRALEGGLLADAFLMVRAVLAAYNPESAYARLDEWEALGCADCGRATDPGDATPCGACRGDVCGDCASACEVCGVARCGSCLRACDACGASCCGTCLEDAGGGDVCPRCATTCSGCGVTVPRQGRPQGARLCEGCAEGDEHEGDTTYDPGPAGPGSA